MSQSHVDFGLKTVGSSGRRTITVTNTTRAKISVAWTPPPLIEVENEKPAADFSVSPDYADIAAGASLDFTVRFHPRKPNVYSLVDLEATVFYKSQRSFRLVNDAVLAPLEVRSSSFRTFIWRGTVRSSITIGAAGAPLARHPRRRRGLPVPQAQELLQSTLSF